MNITASLLDRWKGTPTDAKPAVKWEREEAGEHGSISYAQLRREVEDEAFDQLFGHGRSIAQGGPGCKRRARCKETGRRPR